MGPAENLKLPDLSLKTVMLVTLLSGQRCQTVHALTLRGMKQTDNHITFELNTLLKTSRPGKHIEPLSFNSYPDDKLLCVVTCLKQYLQKKTIKCEMGMTSCGLVLINHINQLRKYCSKMNM